MTFGSRLKKARKNNKMTQDELAAMLNSARPTISSWENDTFLPGIENITALASALNVSIAYLMGESDSFLPDEKEEKDFLHDDDIIKIRIFPLEVAASFDETTNLADVADVVFKEENLINVIFVDKKYLTTCSNAEELFGVVVWDNSMQGAQMTKGQIAIIERTTQIISGDVMFVTYSGHSFFRWLITKPDGVIELRPANQDFKSEFTTQRADIKVKGQVVGVVNMPHAPQKAF